MTNYTETLELIADCHKEGFDKEDFAKELGRAKRQHRLDAA